MGTAEIEVEDTSIQIDDATITVDEEVVDYLVYGNYLFVVTDFRQSDENLYCYDVAGSFQWAAKESVQSGFVGITLRDGDVVTQTMDGSMFVVDPETGELTYEDAARY